MSWALVGVPRWVRVAVCIAACIFGAVALGAIVDRCGLVGVCMSTQIKEALTACVLIRRHLFGSITEPAPYQALESVRRAIEAAQQEAEAWEVIERWCLADELNSMCIRRFSPAASTSWRVTLDPALTPLRAYNGFLLREALIKAADWCRAELAK